MLIKLFSYNINTNKKHKLNRIAFPNLYIKCGLSILKTFAIEYRYAEYVM